MHKIQTTFVDMDGVLVDWLGGACRVHGRDRGEIWKKINQEGHHQGPHLVFGLSAEEFWGKIVDEGPHFWESLELLPWAVDLLAVASKHSEICILTSPSKNPGCMDGKRNWLWDHFGKEFGSYLIGPQKFHSSRPGSLLVDDHEANVDLFPRYGGEALLVPQPWNRHGHLYCDEGKWLLSTLEERLRRGDHA